MSLPPAALRRPPARVPRRLAGAGCILALAVALVVATGPASGAGELPVTGREVPGLAPFDRRLRSTLAEHDVPGAALAVVKDSRLVLARGYGLADPKTGRPVRPRSLFRIASVSKPVTALAVLRLAARGALRLDDPVVDHLKPGTSPADPRWRRVTVRHLLRHTGGLDRELSGDPMFRPARIARDLGLEGSPAPRDVARWLFRQPLDFAPGSRRAYSNAGYCLLGRVVEAAGDAPYEDVVRREVLEPLGIDGMRLGRTARNERAPREVVYLGEERGGTRAAGGTDEGARETDSTSETAEARDACGSGGAGGSATRGAGSGPYGDFRLELMDAHGGWLASAVDLARLARAMQNIEESGFLPRRLHEAMLARPEGPPGQDEEGRPADWWYGLGWAVRDAGKGRRNVWHAGIIDGTAALLVLRHDGLAWAVLLSRRRARDGRELTAVLDPLLHRAADAVEAWPEHDLFPRFDVSEDTRP